MDGLPQSVTSRLFDRLDASLPGLTDRIFDGIKKCGHCYEPCMARVHIAYRGRTQDICQEAGWATIGDSPADFENLRIVLDILDELVSEKRK